MLLQCLECNYKCGDIAVLKYHYESIHKDKTEKCMCGNIIISGICDNDFSQWGCSLKNESSSSSNSSSNPSSNSNSNSSSNPSSSSNPNSNSSSNPSSSSSSSSSSGTPVLALVLVLVLYMTITLTQILTPTLTLTLSPNPNPNLIPNPDLNPSSEELTRCCNKCNYIKPLNNFDEGKYTCRSCTSAKVNCPYCTSVVRYDGIRAHVKKQHPDIELTRGFSRNIIDRCNRFADKTINPRRQSPRAVSPLVINQTENLRSSFTDICSCKYYNFVSFLINNGINIEKIKKINLLKSIDNLK